MFFEAVRIIKEMRDATNSIYPRATIWENVPGALSSNKGADFGVVLSSLADIGAITQEYAVLDAQYFGVPQRRRRIFLVSIFDPAASERCPDPLLPVIQGSRGDFAKGRKARKDATQLAEAGFDAGGQWWDGQATADCLTTTSNEQRMPDKNRLQAVIVPDEIVGALCARDYKGVGNQYVEENKLVVQEAVVPLKTSNTKANGMNVGEPGDPMYTLDTGNSLAVAYKFDSLASNSMKSANPNSGCNEADIAPTLDTWTPDPSLNQGGIAIVEKTLGPVAYSIREDAKNNNFSATETDTALCLSALIPSPQSHHAQIFIAEPQPPYVFDGTRHDDFRMDTETVPTLKQRMGTGGGQVPMLAEPIEYEEIIGFASLNGFGDIQDSTEVFPVLRTTSLNHAVAVSFAYDALNDTANDIHQTLRATQGSNGDFKAQPMLAFDPEIIGPLTSSGMSRARGTESVESNHVLAINTPMLAVRRLTPLECERLMGWPDDHTRWTADGKEQADTNRYKQCGNGVASPVAKWVGEQLRPVLETE